MDTFKPLNSWQPAPMPCNETTPLIAPELCSRILPSDDTSANDFLSRIRKTWLNHIYQQYIKRSVFMRGLARWLWNHAFPIYIKTLHLLMVTRVLKQPLVPLSMLPTHPGVTRYELVDKSIVEITVPAVFPVSTEHYLSSNYTQYVYPKIFVTTIQKALIYGGTNLVLTADKVICHDLYDFKTDYTSEELHGRAIIYAKTKSIRWLLNDTAPEAIPAAAVFVDSCASNYAHWLTEILPRICLFCSYAQFKGIPLIINDGLHNNLIESLFLVCGDREIIFLPLGRAITVEHLYSMSPTGYIPFDKRSNQCIDQRASGLFSPDAFKMLREQINQKLPIIQHANFPKKIYLRRNSSARKLLNEAEIEATLVARGFSIIATEQLNFAQQVTLFKHAEVIIGATGAACANLIFSNPHANIVILMGIHKNTPYRYWLHMANAAGVKKISYLLGRIVKNKSLKVHGDYQISMHDLLSYLNTLES